MSNESGQSEDFEGFPGSRIAAQPAAAPRVTIVGAGVVGLTTALVLQRAGHPVSVVAEEIGAEASSRVAGAIWFPYQVGIEERAAQSSRGADGPATWGEQTYRWLRANRSEVAGISAPIRFYLLMAARAAGSQARQPAWCSALPKDVSPRWLLPEDLPDLARARAESTGASGAWMVAAPVVDPVKHLGWLERRLGDVFVRAKVEDLAAFLAASDSSVLVNCTGRRARALTQDAHLRPRLGHLYVATTEGEQPDYAFADEEAQADGSMCYLIPRAGSVVLGGYSAPATLESPSEAWTSAAAPAFDQAIGAGILKHFEGCGLGPLRHIEPQAEWRPFRPGGVDGRGAGTVRLEWEGAVLHNYGHGGSGFTLAYGCALAVRRMIAARFSSGSSSG